MAIEKPPRLGTTPQTSSLDALKKYTPPAVSIRQQITTVAGQSLGDIAVKAGMEFWDYVEYVFPGCDKDPACINWYLHYRLNCPETRDGKNRYFSGGEHLPLPFPPLAGAPGRLEPVGPGPTDRYLRDRVAAYAEKYAAVANPQFVPYVDDCTSFVSQCLFAGGWPMLEGKASSVSAWWYGLGEPEGSLPGDILDWIRNLPRSRGQEVTDTERERSSRTWSGAQNFHDFLKRSGRAQPANSGAALQPGDVVQAAKVAYQLVHHTFIVTRRIGADDLRLANHSGTAPIRQLSNVRKNLPDGEVLIFWKLKDRIP